MSNDDDIPVATITMTESVSPSDESTRRLRAAVRTFMSPAIWLLAGYQTAMLFFLRVDLQQHGENVANLYGPLIFAALFLGFFFLAAGTYQSFVSESSLVRVPMIFRNARLIFTRFLMLSIKVGLLGFLLINIMVVVAQGFTGMEPEEIFKVFASYLTLIVAATTLALIYWLPLVFVKGNFNMLETIREALQLAWARVGQIGFLAALILLPPLLLWLMSDQLPPAITVLGSIIGELLGWVAFVYCVDFLKTEYAPATKTGA